MKKLFNPFEYYSEKAIIAFSIAVMGIGSVAAWYFGGRFDGVVDFHLSDNVAVWQPFLDNAIATISLVLPLFILGKTLNKRTRVIDIIAAAMAARLPFMIEPLFNIGGYLRRTTDGLVSKITAGTPTFEPQGADLAVIILFALMSILLLVWFAILLYNGFKTATNIKKTAHIILFVAGVIIAEIISSIINYFI